MTVAVTPYEVRSLRMPSTRHYRRKSQRLWALNIAGPFCFWPKRKSGVFSETVYLANDISDILKLPTMPESHADNTVIIRVIVTQEVKDKLIREDYQDKTHARR